MRAGRKPARRPRVARTSFTLKPGATKRVALRFDAPARRAIKRAGAVRIALRLAVPGGRPRERTLTVRLRRR